MSIMYLSEAKIEIIDKAQDSEMSLPTSMTIFNRSMINIENEIGVLTSFRINSRTVKSLKSNIRYYTSGNIKISENHFSDWFEDYNLKFKINTDTIRNKYKFTFSSENQGLVIKKIDSNDNIVKEYIFDKTFSTKTYANDLPFDFEVKNNTDFDERILTISPVAQIANLYKSRISVSPAAKNSDQLSISIVGPNKKINNEFLNALINEFDRDGIVDRQLEYKRTMDFVDSRSSFLTDELEKIELEKQEFKQNNELYDIKSDVTINVNQKLTYNAELFDAEAQRDLALLLDESLNINEYNLLPYNIGIQDQRINQLINEFNLLVKERNRLSFNVGRQNYMLVRIDNQLDEYFQSIKVSIKNYISSLNLKIQKLTKKENEFSQVFNSIPENEKILRSIERELEIKESLFLLLLQKREEAAINYAVVKPSIKVIDSAISSSRPVAPNRFQYLLLSLLAGIFIPVIFLYLRFTTDTKIHTRFQLEKALNDKISIIAEIPHVAKDEYILDVFNNNSRNPITESFRMLISNLGFTKLNNANEKVYMVTSSIKGEGKTLVSISTAAVLSHNNKVILIGCDLRNPQIHKYLGVDKSIQGLSDYIHKDDLDHRDIIVKKNNLDIILSGTIPPNPNQILRSEKFSSLINVLRSEYDYVLLDTAPSLVVSDTYDISHVVDSTLYVIRSNYSENSLTDYMNNTFEENKLPNMNVVLNSVGNSRAYGYGYGYQYGYRYKYNYSYNYGYGYGYGEDSSES